MKKDKRPYLHPAVMLSFQSFPFSFLFPPGSPLAVNFSLLLLLALSLHDISRKKINMIITKSPIPKRTPHLDEVFFYCILRTGT